MGARKLCTPCPQLVTDRNMGVRMRGRGRLCAHLWADALVPVLRSGGWVCPGVSSLVLMSVLHTEAMQSLQECEVQECALCVQHTCMS